MKTNLEDLYNEVSRVLTWYENPEDYPFGDDEFNEHIAEEMYNVLVKVQNMMAEEELTNNADEANENTKVEAMIDKMPFRGILNILAAVCGDDLMDAYGDELTDAVETKDLTLLRDEIKTLYYQEQITIRDIVAEMPQP